MIDSLIEVLALFASFALPICALMFWISWIDEGAIGTKAGEELRGLQRLSAQHAQSFGSTSFPSFCIGTTSSREERTKDEAWWALVILSIRTGLALSAAGVLFGLMGKGRTRAFSTASSALMVLTYFVLFSIR